MFDLIMKSSISNPPTVPLVQKKNNEKTNAPDEKKNTLGNKEVMKVWELSKLQRFDPTKKSASILELSADDAEKRNNAALATLAAINLVKQQKEKDEALQAAAETIALEKIKADDNYANLDTLKSIFHQEVSIKCALSCYVMSFHFVSFCHVLSSHVFHCAI